MELKPGYKQTEVGVIPEDWEVQELSNVAELTSSKRIFETDYVQSGIPFYRGTEISALSEGLSISDPLFISEVKFEEIEGRFGAPQKGDILITAVGTLGNIFVVNFDARFYFKDGNLIWLRKIKENDPAFLGLLLKFSKQSILDCAIGSSQKALTIVALKNLSLALPPLPEQRAIATALSEVDGLIRAQEQLIAKKRDLKQAAMQQLLTAQHRLPGFSGEWVTKRLGEIAEMGSGGTPPSGVPAYYDGDIPWVSIADMTKRGALITATDRNLTEKGLLNSAAKIFPAGTVLYAIYASIGECSIAGIDLCSSQAILGIRPKKDLRNRYLYYFLTSKKEEVKKLGQQGTQANLNKGIVQDFKLPIPPLPEQTAIAEVLSEQDEELAALEARLAKTRALKQAAYAGAPVLDAADRVMELVAQQDEY
jgi:type I restriction enzyme S subunit